MRRGWVTPFRDCRRQDLISYPLWNAFFSYPHGLNTGVFKIYRVLEVLIQGHLEKADGCKRCGLQAGPFQRKCGTVLA